MAAPKRNRSHPDDPASKKTREKIRATQLAKRLQYYALGEPDEQGNQVDLSASQIRAIEILLKKTVPDLQSTELTGPNNQPLMPSIMIAEKKIS